VAAQTVLITGANRGIGQQVARVLATAGWDVLVGSRDRKRGDATAKRLRADTGGRLRAVELDVTSDASVTAAAARVRGEAGHLDVLVNNAGIPGGFKAAGETTAADLEAVYATNVFGVVRVTHAFLPLLELSAAPVIVNVSSGLGSLAVTNNPDRFESTLKGLAYPSSKSAVNMLTSQYAKSYPQIRVNAVDPGYTATDLNSNRGTQTIEQGAEIIVAMATTAPTGPTGTFRDRHGPVPW
jgi:NAD(P)-dependent dehydrogenase (short-subunit alcohol dehydrogenase family)